MLDYRKGSDLEIELSPKVVPLAEVPGWLALSAGSLMIDTFTPNLAVSLHFVSLYSWLLASCVYNIVLL